MSESEEIAHQFVHANGLQFHVASCGASDKLALLLHGFPECWYSWRYQLPLLARLGYRAWAVDLRGYGETDRPPRRQDYAIRHLLDDVAGLIDTASARSTILLGHDWGAAIAWFFAIHKVRPLDRLVIMNVPHPVLFRRALRTWRQLLRSWYMFYFQIPRLPEALLGRSNCRAIGNIFRSSAVDKSRFPDEVLRVYRENAAHPGALTAMLNYYRAAIRGGALRQTQRDYPVIEVPTLMIWGEHDVALGEGNDVRYRRVRA